jgi:alanine racemase
VRTVAEAEAVSGSFESVLVLAELPQKLVAQNIHITLNTPEAIAKLPEGTAVHLKIDTGMHRNGIAPGDLETALQKIKAASLRLAGVFTHSRSGDELSSELFWQYKNFTALKTRCEALCDALAMPRPLFHFANSPSLLRFGEMVAFDRVRVGIAAYGYIDAAALMKRSDLRPVLSLWGEKIASRRVVKGERVGYGGTGLALRDGVVSTYDLGYADGLFRHDGSAPFALEDGTAVMGKISMDNLSLASEADEIRIIADARHWAKRFGTITYDVLVKLSPRIKKEIV